MNIIIDTTTQYLKGLTAANTVPAGKQLIAITAVEHHTIKSTIKPFTYPNNTFRYILCDAGDNPVMTLQAGYSFKITPATYSSQDLLTRIQTQFSTITHNSLKLNRFGKGMLRHNLGSHWYNVTLSDDALTVIKTKNTVKISGGSHKQRIIFQFMLIIPDNLNHLLTRTP